MSFIVAGSAHNHTTVIEELKNSGELLPLLLKYGQFQFHPVAENTSGSNSQGPVTGQFGTTGLVETEYHAVLTQELVGGVFKDRIEFLGHGAQASVHTFFGLGCQHGFDLDFDLRPGPGPAARQQQDEHSDPRQVAHFDTHHSPHWVH